MPQEAKQPFDLERWKSELSQKLPGWKQRMQAAGVKSVYSAVAASALLPAAAAFQSGDVAGVYLALGGLLGGVGGNLLANLLQNWKDENAAATAIESDLADPALRAELDAILEKLAALPQAAAALSNADRQWFLAALKDELARLGSAISYPTVVNQVAIYQAHQTVHGPQTNLAGNANALVLSGQFNGPVHAGSGDQYNITNAPDPDPAVLRASYLNWVLEQVSHLSLSGIDPKAASEAEARLSLGAVYTALLTQSSESMGELEGRTRQLDPELRPDRQPKRLSALAQLDRHPRLVLLGDPGSGKSTFVNFTALCLAGEALGRADANLELLRTPLPSEPDERQREAKKPQPQPWSHGALLPVRVVLRDFAARGLPEAGRPASAKHLQDFIAAELTAAALGEYCDLLFKTLREQGGLLLLDGLDEVPEAQDRRSQLKQAVEGFAAAFPMLRILVTSRTYAYQKQDWRLNGFNETVLADFSAGQIEQFVERWYAHIAHLRNMNPEDAQGRAELLKRAIRASDRLQGLAARPLLLTLMASLHAWRGGTLPERREELYADTVDLLLDWWESPKIVRDRHGEVITSQPSLAEYLRLDDRQKLRRLLEELAFNAHSSQPDLQGTADIPEDALIGGLTRLSGNPDLRPTRLMEYLSQRAGLLVPRGVGVYTFPHRTFQEYLAACYLTDHDFPDLVAGLACADFNRWREVALLAGAKAGRGTASAVWTLVDALCYADITPDSSPEAFWGAVLAGQALVESGSANNLSERNRGKLARVQGGLVHVLGIRLPAIERAGAGRSLARLGDPRPEVLTCADMEFCFVPAGPFRMGEGEETHTVDLPAFWMGRQPVTQAQFGEFVTAGGYREGRFWEEARAQKFWSKTGFKGPYDSEPRQGPYHYGDPFDLLNHPVVGISWYEALAFSRWLGEQAGLTGSLPSEAEWEKAARGGLEIPTVPRVVALAQGLSLSGLALQPNPLPEREYPWGDDADPDKANYTDTGIGSTSAVGCFPGGTSPYGALDLSGNVWEWVRSKYSSYPYHGSDGREDLSGYEDRVLRGGAFNLSVRGVRCAYRGRHVPDFILVNFGFRVVLLLPPQA